MQIAPLPHTGKAAALRGATAAFVLWMACSWAAAGGIASGSGTALDFEEKVVAGGPDDFMIVRHLRLRGSNRELGRKLAEIGRERHAARPEPCEPIALRARRDFYRKNWPTHYARSAGAAEAFGLNLETATLDCTSVWVNVGPPPGCSTVYYPAACTESGHSILSRNYDFSTGTFAEITRSPAAPRARPMTSDVYLLESYPDEGYPSLVVTPYDLLGGCMDGMNSKGLTVALLADDSSNGAEPATDPQAGLSEIEVPRFLLDTCATVDEAKAALMSMKQYYGFLPCHYIIGDRAGRSFVWEYSSAHNREYITDGDGRPQVVTNHLLCKFANVQELPAESSPNGTFNRLRRLNEEIAEVSGKLPLGAIKRINRAVAVDPSRTPGRAGRSPNRTLWHSLYDCEDASMEIDFYLGEDASAANRQKRSGYLRFQLQGK